MPTAAGALETDVLVVGTGPAGSGAATWAARAGLDVLAVDCATFPRDKTCGDGLTPRAITEMNALGMAGWLRRKPRNWGLLAEGFGRTWHLPWPGGQFPDYGSAAPRTELDQALMAVATSSGARFESGIRIVAAEKDPRGFVRSVTGRRGSEEIPIRCRRLIIADGAQSGLGRQLGRIWHRDTAYGVAARCYVTSTRSREPWIAAHMDIRSPSGKALSGYGWVFPLGDGNVNLGVGTLATRDRPARINLGRLLSEYFGKRVDDWGLTGTPRAVKSALLPMGGSVTGIAGPNWVLVGDAAGCVNPLNGEGIDYGLETGRLAGELFGSGAGLPTPGPSLPTVWPATLARRYGHSYSIARRISALFTNPELVRRGGPLGMRSRRLMSVALRIGGNLVTEEDDDYVARMWRWAGRASRDRDQRPPFTN